MRSKPPSLHTVSNIPKFSVIDVTGITLSSQACPSLAPRLGQPLGEAGDILGVHLGPSTTPSRGRLAPEPFARAGVYDVWRGDGGKAIASCAIVTTDAAPSVAQYHNRMPVVLDDAQFNDWMRGSLEQAAGMMKPYAGEIEASEVAAENDRLAVFNRLVGR